MMKKVTSIIMIALLALTVSCGSKEEKKAKFFDKGIALLEKGDYVRARLEFKNALQIDPKFADAYYMLGKVDMKDREFKRAYGYYNKAIELNPDFLDAQVELARIYVAARAEDKAKEKVDLVLSKDPQNRGAKLVQAALLIKSKQIDAAKSILDHLYESGETSPELYLMLASIHNEQNDAESIETMLTEGIRKNPDATNLQLILANFYIQTDKTTAAESVLKTLVEKQPDVSGHQLALAEFYWKTDQREKTQQVLESLAAREPDQEENTIAAARFYLRQNAVDRGEDLLISGIKDNSESFKLREALADLYLLKKDPQKAMTTLKESLSLSSDPADPGILKAKSKMARIFLMQRDYAQAQALVDDILKENARSVEGNFINGQLHLAAGRGADAVTAFRTVVAENPENANAYLLMAQAHLMIEEIPLAIDVLSQGIRQIPAAKDLHRALAKVYMTEKQMDKAEAQLVKMTETDPNDVRAMGDLGDFKLSLEQYDAAEQWYVKMVETSPQMPNGYLKMARLYDIRGEREKAMDILADGYARSPNSLPLLAGLVKVRLRDGDITEAQRLCEEKITAQPDNAFLYNLLAQVALTAKDLPAAEKALKAAINRQPEWNVPHDNLARLYLSQGKTAQAIANLESAIAQNPQNTGAYLTLAFLYDKKDDTDKAKSTYEKALEANPRQWAAANNLAFLMAEHPNSADDLDRAMDLARKAETLKPEEPTVLDTLGWVHYKKGNRQEAIRILEDALEKNAQIGVINYHLARVLVDSDRFAEARGYLDNALADSSDFPEKKDARALLDDLDQKQGRGSES